jgi:hypothetical protein
MADTDPNIAPKTGAETMSKTDWIVDEIKTSWMSGRDLDSAGNEAADLKNFYEIDPNNATQMGSVARLVMRGGWSVLVCSVEKVCDGLIRCQLVNDHGLRAMIDVGEIAMVKGNPNTRGGR